MGLIFNISKEEGECRHCRIPGVLLFLDPALFLDYVKKGNIRLKTGS
jgi:hypothetical protein